MLKQHKIGCMANISCTVYHPPKDQPTEEKCKECCHSKECNHGPWCCSCGGDRCGVDWYKQEGYVSKCDCYKSQPPNH